MIYVKRFAIVCIAFLAILILFAQFSFVTLTYCEGYDTGYAEGWCYDERQPEFCIAPLSPPCPITEAGRTRYEDGYNQGFKEGKADKKHDN